MSSTVFFEEFPPRVKDASLILAVNDNPDSLSLFRAIFRDDCFEVLTAESGAAGLDLARGMLPDLIVSDVVMPGMNGIELCRQLKADPATREIPILLLSALSFDEAAIVEGLRAGADDYVVAHAPLELLRNKVEHMIAERKREQVTRLESEKHFRTLIENSLDIVTILNADGTIRYESPSVESVLGYSPTELIGKSAFKLIHPEDLQNVLRVFKKGLQEDSYTARLEFRFLHKNGSWRVLEAIGKNLLNEPKVRGVIVNSRDVTERNQAQARVNRVDARFQLALDSVKEYAIFMLDPDGYVISWNSGAERIKGFKTEEIIGEHLSRFYTAADVEEGKPYDQLWSAMTDGGCEYEGWRLRKDGSRFWANVVLTALRDEQGKLDGFLKVTRDMTDRRRREELRRQSDRLLRAILNNSPATIYIKDTEGRYLLVNRQFETLLNLNHEEIIGKTDHDLFNKEIADVFRAHDKQVSESGLPIEVEEIAVMNGKQREYLSIKFPLNAEAGKPYAVCGISTDITDHKSVQDQLRQAQKMEAIGMLAGGVAHDFNNVLTAIIGYSQLLLKNTNDTDLRRTQAEEIEKAGRRAASLARQLLTFSRKQKAQPRVVDANLIVESMIRMLGRLISEDVELVAVLDPELGLIKADPNQIEQVILNLAVNARDAMPDGGKLTIETANVELDTEFARIHPGVTPGDYVMLAVSDTGCGMDKETQSRIFEPFFTTKEPGKGTGFGLSTVYGIVKHSGGHIWVYSEPGNGSEFKVYFPRVEGTPELTEAPDTNASKNLPVDAATVLVVEDDDGVRELASAVLEMDGHTVLGAATTTEALQISQDHSEEIDILITDVVMPEMNGRALANSIGVNRPDIKVLYLSGYTSETIIHHGLLEPGMALLEKPFTPEMLARKVREVLDKESESQSSVT